ncbi:MAG TPA: glutaredoxin family protein [Chloroflexota bacterium]
MLKSPATNQPKEAAPTTTETASSPESGEVIIYGTAWCGDCHRTRRYLDRHQVPYQWIDADAHPEATEIIKKINHGRRSVPTLIFPDGTTMTEPANSELARKLGIDERAQSS